MNVEHCRGLGSHLPAAAVGAAAAAAAVAAAARRGGRRGYEGKRVAVCDEEAVFPRHTRKDKMTHGQVS
jgi:hypothetical protein